MKTEISNCGEKRVANRDEGKPGLPDLLILKKRAEPDLSASKNRRPVLRDFLTGGNQTPEPLLAFLAKFI